MVLVPPRGALGELVNTAVVSGETLRRGNEQREVPFKIREQFPISLHGERNDEGKFTNWCRVNCRLVLGSVRRVEEPENTADVEGVLEVKVLLACSSYIQRTCERNRLVHTLPFLLRRGLVQNLPT